MPTLMSFSPLPISTFAKIDKLPQDRQLRLFHPNLPMHPRCTRTKLLVVSAAPVVFPAPALVDRRQDLALFLKCVGHDLVRLEIARRLQFRCGIDADPLPADAEVEEGDQ